MKDRFRCVTTDLPGFSGDDARAEKWGYSTEEVVKRIERTVERVGNGQPIILVAHDFGCIYSFKFEAKRPDLVRKFVAIDVGGAMKPSVCGAVLMVTYQVRGRRGAERSVCTYLQVSDPLSYKAVYCRGRSAPQSSRHHVFRRWAQSHAHAL